MKQVLIVDDDVFLTDLYSKLLTKEGVMVDAVNSGDEALKRIAASPPDLVVLDIHMPGMKGTDVLRTIRHDLGLQHLCVIVFATGYIKNLVAEVGDLDAQKIISKMKCKPRELVAEIQDSLANLPDASSVPEGSSALEVAVGHLADPGNKNCALWLDRLKSDSRDEARRVCVLHIYYLFRGQILQAMQSDALSPEGKLGRALRKLVNDLYDHPHLIQDSTVDALGQALRKLQAFSKECRKDSLESESLLKDILADL